jgi:anti-anti-sigma factor
MDATVTAAPPLIVLRGDLDVFSSSRMRDALAVLAEPAVIDMTGVRQVDAAALGVLASAARQVGVGNLTLIVARGNLARVIKMVGFHSLCRVIIDRRQEASFGSRLARRRTDRAQAQAAETATAV